MVYLGVLWMYTCIVQDTKLNMHSDCFCGEPVDFILEWKAGYIS